jgi:hypothetical protein
MGGGAYHVPGGVASAIRCPAVCSLLGRLFLPERSEISRASLHSVCSRASRAGASSQLSALRAGGRPAASAGADTRGRLASLALRTPHTTRQHAYNVHACVVCLVLLRLQSSRFALRGSRTVAALKNFCSQRPVDASKSTTGTARVDIPHTPATASDQNFATEQHCEDGGAARCACRGSAAHQLAEYAISPRVWCSDNLAKASDSSGGLPRAAKGGRP